MQIVATIITTTNKLLDYEEEAKGGSVNREDTQGEKQHTINKNKGKGKAKSFGKTSEKKAKQVDTPKEKGKHASCWICAKEHYAKNCPLRNKLSTMEQVDKPSIGVL
jgi:hypothetical protein